MSRWVGLWEGSRPQNVCAACTSVEAVSPASAHPIEYTASRAAASQQNVWMAVGSRSPGQVACRAFKPKHDRVCHAAAEEVLGCDAPWSAASHVPPEADFDPVQTLAGDASPARASLGLSATTPMRQERPGGLHSNTRESSECRQACCLARHCLPICRTPNFAAA